MSERVEPLCLIDLVAAMPRFQISARGAIRMDWAAMIDETVRVVWIGGNL